MALISTVAITVPCSACGVRSGIFNAHAVSQAEAGESRDELNRQLQKIATTIESSALGGGTKTLGTEAVERAAGKGISSAGNFGFKHLNNALFPIDHEASAVDRADATIDQTITAMEERFNATTVDDHLADLYRRRHEAGVELDDLLKWEHFGAAFEAAARQNGISAEPDF